MTMEWNDSFHSLVHSIPSSIPFPYPFHYRIPNKPKVFVNPPELRTLNPRKNSNCIDPKIKMSDHIPFELQIQIMKNLPVKSLIQFRSVSKQWKTLIDSSDFIVDYTVSSHAQPQQHLLMRYKNSSCEELYISFVDDHTFPQNTFSPTVPTSVELIWRTDVIGISHGLVCVLGYTLDPDGFPLYSRTATAVVWNPFIRKSVSISIPNADHGTSLRFGVCPRTCDPKIIKIDYFKTVSGRHWQVEIFSLSSGVWRSSIGNLPGGLVADFNHSQVVIDGTVYWFGITQNVDTSFPLLISFDLSYEEFEEIHLPFKLALPPLSRELSLCNRCDSLAVIKGCSLGQNFEVWMMEKNADSKSFIKLFSVEIEYGDLCSSSPLAFRRNGELVMIVFDYTDEPAEPAVIVVYDPVSKHFKDLGIKGIYDYVTMYPISMSPYTKSLILLDK